jgi:chromate transporter
VVRRGAETDRTTTESSAAGAGRPQPQAGLAEVLLEWGRIGCIGFGGPPAHIALLRQLCVQRKGWLEGPDFEDALAACNLLPGPASTQLAIYCAGRVRGRLGALAGGVAFIVPGLILILALAAVFLASAPPTWIRGVGAGAGAAVAAVALRIGLSLVPSSWRSTRVASGARWVFYIAVGAAAAATLGPSLVLVLLACGGAELALQRRPSGHLSFSPVGMIAAAAAASGGLLALAWVAFKVGALSYGGGFVIVPLMQADAVSHYHWMTAGQFLNAVALGQVTPGPLVQTVAVVGYAAAGVGGGLLAAGIAFSPSFAFILLGGRRFERLRADYRARAFLDGAGPAAIGAILGSAIALARALHESWQFAVLGAAAILLLVLRRGVVSSLLAAAAVGLVVALAGGPLPA